MEAPLTIVPEVMDIRVLSRYLGLGKSKIYALIRMKKIPASRIGRQYRFSKNVIEQWLKEKLITKNQEPQMSLSFSDETRPSGFSGEAPTNPATGQSNEPTL